MVPPITNHLNSTKRSKKAEFVDKLPQAVPLNFRRHRLDADWYRTQGVHVTERSGVQDLKVFTLGSEEDGGGLSETLFFIPEVPILISLDEVCVGAFKAKGS